MTPPSGTCLSATRAQTSRSVGTCSGTAACSYQSMVLDCSNGCLNGACIAGSWTLSYSPYTVALINGNTVYDAAGFPVMVGCTTTGIVRLRRESPTGWTEETIDTGMGSNCRARVALTPTGEPMVTWFDSVNVDLRFALRNGGLWSPKELIANQGDVGFAPSIVVDPQGAPIVAYASASDMNIATRTNGVWASTVIAHDGSSPWRVGSVSELVYRGSTLYLGASSLGVMARSSGGSWSSVVSNLKYPSPLFGSLSFESNGTPVVASGSNLHRFRWPTETALSTFGSSALLFRATPPWAAVIDTAGGWQLLVERNSVFTPAVTTVPFRSSMGTLSNYSGANGQHELLNTLADKLTSPACVPQCSGRTCGDDGCGGSCGTCASGTCGPVGTCSPFQVALAPSSSSGGDDFALGTAGGSLHVVAQQTSIIGSRYLTWQVSTDAGWAPAEFIPGEYLQSHGVVRVDASGNPVVLASLGSSTWQAFTVSRDGGAWNTGPDIVRSADALGVDSTGRWYDGYGSHFSEHQLNVQVATNGVWAMPTNVFTLPVGSSPLTYSVNSTGTSTFICELPDAGVVSVSNATGTWAQATVPGLVGSYTTVSIYDGAGVLHVMSESGYARRAPGGNWVSETLPANVLPAAANYSRVLRIDGTGALTTVWVASSTLHVARRTGVGTWNVESAGLINATSLEAAAFDGNGRLWALVRDNGELRLISR